MTIATCIGCSCDEDHADEGDWLRVDRQMGMGVCSGCPEYVKPWDETHAFGPAHFDLVAHLRRMRAFSLRTFGPGPRPQGIIDHIRKELVEIEAAPDDLYEWVDVVLLALNGAWRAGHDPIEIALAIAAKQTRNELRTWPDWRTAEPGKAIEHVRKNAQPL